MSSRSLSSLVLGAGLTLVVAGCGKTGQAPQMPPPEVGVIGAHASSLPLVQEYVGRLSPVRKADVRARIAGILLKRLYTEGSDVHEGQALFQIDPAPLQAALDAQLANLSSAQASAANAKAAADRARAMASTHFMSQTDVDNALANERTTAAAVKQAQANVESARLNLGYALVTAPISGRADQQQVTEGALVGQGEATLLTTIEQLDPIYVNFSQPVAEINKLREAQVAGKLKMANADEAEIEINFPGGKPYAHKGTLGFSGISVDTATGAVNLRGTLPNPEHELLPGTFIDVRVSSGEQSAFRVLAAAVQRDDKGFYVLVVGAQNKVAQKHVTTSRLDGDAWIVTDGIAEGDKLIVSGLQKAHPEATVNPVAWQANAGNGAAPTAAGKQAEAQSAN